LQVLIGVLTVAQFVPEPMSSAAQTFLASTAGEQDLKSSGCS
jgi:hypothetical protein